MAKNDFLRQIIGYEYHPDMPWMKDNYFIQEGYEEIVREALDEMRNE
jgi:hypothetical protein